MLQALKRGQRARSGRGGVSVQKACLRGASRSGTARAFTAANGKMGRHSFARRMSAFAVFAIAGSVVFSAMPTGHASQPPATVALQDSAIASPGGSAITTLVQRLSAASLSITDRSGKVILSRGEASVAPISESDIVAALAGASLTEDEASTLWEFFADEDNVGAMALPVIKALVTATRGPKAREAMWSEIFSVWQEHKDNAAKRDRSLLGFFERNRAQLLAAYPEMRETESTGDEMVDMMPVTRLFGASVDESIAWLAEHHPAALARRMERERGKGKPVAWEATAFKAMLRWKEARLLPNSPRRPTTLEALDAMGESFVIIFNCLHDMDPKYRETMLKGLGPVEVFNAAVGGEMELYRLGTSSYRDHLHAVIMRGMKESGSFEAFLDRATMRQFGNEAVRGIGSRAMVFLRIVSSFGLLEPVLEHVKDRSRFIDQALASLGDPRTFERNGSVVMDLITSRSNSPAAAAFKKALLDKLYERYRTESVTPLRSVYASMLSVYQTVTGDRRDGEIDRAFPLDDTTFRLPFNRLFSPDGKGGLVHRMFMRMDEDVDAATTYANFRLLMRSRGASLREERYHDVFRISARGRTIEIYANKPTALGTRRGINDIAAALKNHRVETVVGRGHTSIITPLQENAKRVLGDRIKNVSAVLVGTCGGDASVRDLIKTFGYRSFFTTRSTGRLVINNAIMETYIAALLAVPQGGRLSLEDVLAKATASFSQTKDSELRDDAGFYRLAMTAVLTAYLFDTHVRQHADKEWVVAQQQPQ